MAQAANPFDLLPANLFNLFSTQGYINLQRHYMAILLRIYSLAEFNRFGLAREVVIAEIVDYLRSEEAGGEVAAEIEAQAHEEGSPSRSERSLAARHDPKIRGAAKESETPAEEGGEGRALTGQKTEGDYAAYLLRRLDETGWIEREQHPDYSETILLPDYAFSLLEAFRSIQEQKPREFTGQLYTAHQLITAASSREDFAPALAVTQAYENVRQVVRGLSELNQNIRRYIERATNGQDVPDLLRLQFDDYAQTLGPAYHALKTSDHVSRYRRDIIGQLQAWQLDSEWLDRTAEDLAAQSRLSPGQASQEVSHYIHFVIHQLESLDPLLEEIDRRHAQYLRTSLRQIRYQLVGADGSFKDRLVSLAQHLSKLKDEGKSELPAGAPALQANPIRLADANSFFTPPQRRAPFTPTLITAPILYPGELVALRLSTLQDITQAVTPKRVNQFVLGFFNGHKKLHVNELPPAVVTDLHWLTNILAYAHHPEVDYGIEVTDGDPVDIGPYRVAPFEILKYA